MTLFRRTTESALIFATWVFIAVAVAGIVVMAGAVVYAFFFS